MSGFKVGRSSIMEYVSDSDSSDSYVMDSSMDLEGFHEKSNSFFLQPSIQPSRGIQIKQEPVSPGLNQQELMKINDEEMRRLEKKYKAAESELAEKTEKLDQETRKLQKATQLNNEMQQQIAELSSSELKSQEEIEGLNKIMENLVNESRNEIQNLQANLVAVEHDMAKQIQRLAEEKTQLEHTIDMCKSDHLNDKTTYESDLDDQRVENIKLRQENEANRDIIEKMLQIDETNKETLKHEQARFELETEKLRAEIKQLTKTVEISSEKAKANTVYENKIQMKEAEVAELKQTNFNLTKKLEVMQNVVRSSVDQLLSCITGGSDPAIQKQMEDGFQSLEMSFLKKKENIEKVCEERRAYMEKGVMSINHEKSRIHHLKGEVITTVQDHKKEMNDTLNEANEKTSQFMDEILQKLNQFKEAWNLNIEEVLQEHVSNNHSSQEADKKRKKAVADRMKEFKETAENANQFHDKIRDIAGQTKDLRKELIENLKAIREWNLQMGSKMLSRDSGEPQPEQNNELPFVEKLCECYWEDETHPDFILGLDAHKYTIQKSLLINEVVIPNQCVSIINISKPEQSGEIDSSTETFAVGYGDDSKTSFMCAIENIRQNRQFMKIRSKFGKSSTCPSVQSSLK